jgi:uncharacterized membrane protein YebE (DUF533 family)
MADVVAPSVLTRNYVEWSAIFAGAVAASAISFVLLTAGAAIGLSLLSPYSFQSYGKFAATVAAFWTIMVPILSLLVGGYIAGRMRTGWEAANADEVEFRDGTHGMLVWAVAVMIGGLLGFLAASTAAQLGGEAAKAAISDRGGVVATSVDYLLRPTTSAPAAPTNSATSSPQSRGAVTPTISTDTRDQITRTFVAATADGELSKDDRQFLAQLVSERTGLPPEEAQKRVDLAYAKALDAIDTAREGAVAAGLATVTALLAGLAAAWYSAQHGGRHRDHNIPARFTFLPPRIRRPNV